MNILLVAPRRSSCADVTPDWLRIPHLPLSVLTALTPPEHELTAVEEEVEPVPKGRWDVVGITAMTATAGRAYDIADAARREGSKVILGGIHPSVLPGEAARHADAVVVGEAETVWSQALHDAARGHLKARYDGGRPDLSESPVPVRRVRRSFLGLPPRIEPVLATRGCPRDCEFCCVHEVYGRHPRHIPIDRVVEDIRRCGSQRVMFLDDNVGGDRTHALALFRAIEPLRVRWSGQATARFILDDALFPAAVRAGLEGVFVGVETVEPEALAAMRKSLDSVAEYERAAARCRAAGVVLHASLIFGLDEQTPRVFERTLDFLVRNSIPSISANVLTPYPGTRLFRRLAREGRILHTNWDYYDHHTVCYRPKGMEPEELTERYLGFRRDFLSWSSILRRAPAQIGVAPVAYFGMNVALRGTSRNLERHFARYFRWLRSAPPGELGVPSRGAPHDPRRPDGCYSRTE